MRLTNEIIHGFSQPMIAPRISFKITHALLNHAPCSGADEEKTMMIQLVAVLHGGGVDLGAHARRIHQLLSRSDSMFVRGSRDLAGRFSAGAALASSDHNSQIR